MSDWRIDTPRPALVEDLRAVLERTAGESLRSRPVDDETMYAATLAQMNAAIDAAIALAGSMPKGSLVHASVSGRLCDGASDPVGHRVNISIDQLTGHAESMAIAAKAAEEAAAAAKKAAEESAAMRETSEALRHPRPGTLDAELDDMAEAILRKRVA